MNIDEFLVEYNKYRPAGKNWIMPGGDHEAKFMLIISYPGYDAMEHGNLLEGANGIELQAALEMAGFKESDYYLTSMVKYDVGSSGKPTKEMIEQCSGVLNFEIDTIKPRLIMTLGAEPFKQIKGDKSKVTNYIGNILDCHYSQHDCKLLPNYSPGMIVNQDPTQRPLFREIFELAKRFLDNRLTYTPYEKIVVSDPGLNKVIIQSYIDQGKFQVGYDAEWYGKKMVDDEVMYTFQYCCEPHVAVVLSISDDGKTENRELLDTMKPLLEHPQVQRMGWNIRADDKRIKLRGFNISDDTLAFDGMKACGFIDSRWGKGLETGIKYYTNYKPYYKDMPDLLKKHKLDDAELAKLKFLEPDFFYDYCAGDAVSHRAACLGMKDSIDKLPEKVRNYWYNTYLPLTSYFTDLELNGIPIDLDKMEELTNLYQGKYNELLENLRDKLKGIDPEFNPNSTPDKKKLLFSTLDLAPAFYTRKGKVKPRAWYDNQKVNVQKQYSPSTNGKSLSTICFDLEKELHKNQGNSTITDKHAIVKNLLDLARVGVFANKFLCKTGTLYDMSDSGVEEESDEESGEGGKKSSYWNSVCSDNKIHPDFFECLDNFRCSSKPNVQNPASKVLSHIPDIFVPGYAGLSKAEQAEKAHLIPGNIRHIFWSGNPDWYWAECDVASADLGILAFLSNDKKYIHDILSGGFHLTKARDYFQDPKVTKNDYSKYVSGKSITFRVAYTSELLAAAIPIQAEIYAESGIYLPIDRIEYALKTWENYTDYMAYRERCKQQVDEHHYIENARGMRYHFEDSSDFKILAGWKNESLAFPPASELALFMWDICVSMKKYLMKEKAWMKWVYPVNSVHDASYFLVHKDALKNNWFPEVCKHFFTKECKIATGDNLGMEMSVSSRWKAKEEIFHGETAWDFKNKSWDWKKE